MTLPSSQRSQSNIENCGRRIAVTRGLTPELVERFSAPSVAVVMLVVLISGSAAAQVPIWPVQKEPRPPEKFILGPWPKLKTSLNGGPLQQRLQSAFPDSFRERVNILWSPEDGWVSDEVFDWWAFRVGREGLIPSEWISGAVGGTSLRANFFASFAGALMYFATLTEVPILQGLIGSGMGKGPALALLLAGPALSLPNMLVIRSVLGTKKTLVFVTLVVIMATLSGLLYGQITG